MHICRLRTTAIPGWSFFSQIGLFCETLSRPELIVVGLNRGFGATQCWNEAAERLKQNIRLEDGHREPELLASVDCIFTRIEQRWLRQAMGFATWFNGTNGFRYSRSFTPTWRTASLGKVNSTRRGAIVQPLLFAHSPLSVADRDFWAANDPESSLYSWKFKEAPHMESSQPSALSAATIQLLECSMTPRTELRQFHGPPESKKEDLAIVCFHHMVESLTGTQRSMTSPISNWVGALGATMRRPPGLGTPQEPDASEDNGGWPGLTSGCSILRFLNGGTLLNLPDEPRFTSTSAPPGESHRWHVPHLRKPTRSTTACARNTLR